jgi:hypothetical protein
MAVIASSSWLKRHFEDNCKILMAKTMNTGTVKRKKKKKTFKL